MFTSVKNVPSVSFFTNCYEADWEQVLKTDRLETMIGNCGIEFSQRGLIINNVNNRALVEGYAKEAVNKGIIDAYYFSGDDEERIFRAFSIKRNYFKLDFCDGYWYSMGPLAAIYHCTSKYLLYFTCDCMMPDGSSIPWITEAINVFDTDPKIFVANPIWEYNKEIAQTRCFKENEDWFFGYGFSDQCFLVENKRLYADIYKYYHISSEIFPLYGGNPFERMVNSYMRSTGLTRITNKHIHYTHEKLINPNSEVKVAEKSIKKIIKQKAGLINRKIRIRINRNFNL